jgi:hypothetical protein
MDCVEACIALDASDPSLATADAGASSAAEAMSSIGAEATIECAAPPFPCERLCWELDARFGRGRPTTLTSIDTSDDTDLVAIGEPLIRCAQARAAECRAGELPPATSAVPGGTSWTGLFLECAGLPVDFDLFD